MAKLGINIDHVATLRQARREFDPDPILAAKICEKAGADSIVCHLREDQRHINLKDVKQLRKIVKTRLNLEMSLNAYIVKLTKNIKPDQATIVPERRQEITTEGGLDVIKHFRRIKRVARELKSKGIQVSLFINPDKRQIQKSKEADIEMIELHTGQYALANTPIKLKKEFARLKKATLFAQELGIIVNAGHGLKYHNTRAVARIKGMEELNIGHSIIAQATFVGLEKAVKEMVRIVK